MPFCPNCRYEYREDIRECPDCGTRLVDKLPEQVPSEDTDKTAVENVNFVPLKNLPSRLYAQMLEEALKNEGIPSITKGDEAVPFRVSTNHIPVSKVSIWVPEQDLEKAREIADWMFDSI